jgi:hypothetical protein
MKNLFLKKIRLSWYFFGFFILFTILGLTIPGVTFEPGALTLFSINSFLYGFYISPVLGNQRMRIEELAKIVRAEANALFGMALQTKKLSHDVQQKVQELIDDYADAVLKERTVAGGEKEYEALITYCIKFKGNDKDKEQIDKILTNIVANQQNRSNLAMQLRSRVFANEWWIMLVLFSVTLGFVLFLNIGDTNIFLPYIKALMCTGLTMLMVSLLKLSTLTHKKATLIWIPLQKLVDTRFYRID